VLLNDAPGEHNADISRAVIGDGSAYGLPIGYARSRNALDVSEQIQTVNTFDVGQIVESADPGATSTESTARALLVRQLRKFHAPVDTPLAVALASVKRPKGQRK